MSKPDSRVEVGRLSDRVEVLEFRDVSKLDTSNLPPIAMCGVMMTDAKITSQKGTGSISIHKVYTRNREQAQSLSEGRDLRTTIIMKLADPDAFGVERLALYNCSFDDETLMDFQAGSPGKVSLPFTFTGWEWMETINP